MSNLASTQANAKWRVTLLGSLFAINDDDYQVNKFRTAKCSSLFAYLVYKKPFRLTGRELRAKIAYDIWQEELEIEVATRRLTTELKWLRDTFGDDVFPPHCQDIVSDAFADGRLIAAAFSTDAGYWINTQVPEARKSKDIVLLRDTVNNYRGPFAPTLTESWAESTRYDLEFAFNEIVTRFAENLWQSGDPQQKLECLTLLETSKIKFRQGFDLHQIYLEEYLRYHQMNNESPEKLRARATSIVKCINSSGELLSDNLNKVVTTLGAITEQ